MVQYADAFETNEIDMDLLRQVDDQMLKDIGVATGQALSSLPLTTDVPAVCGHHVAQLWAQKRIS